MKKILLLLCVIAGCLQLTFGWGFYGHKQINHHAVFLLPPAMMAFYKPNIDFITEHAVDPDKRRYTVREEGPRHYIDLNRYGAYPFSGLPRNWNDAVEKFGEDSLKAHGIVPWWIHIMLQRLTNAFREKNYPAIVKLSAEIGHYIADAHVPLHAHSNYNGQQTNQHGIHGLWESRIPELLAATDFDYLLGKAEYISNPPTFVWQRVLESAAAADTVLELEKAVSLRFSPDFKYAFEERNGLLVRQYSGAFTIAYNAAMKGMVERRMRQSVFATASLWYTAWINAGQPALEAAGSVRFSEEDIKIFSELDKSWKAGNTADRTCGN
ncbi:MAG: S1/P1 Nuclease [Chitinophagaceae bacterium]|nr:S1/P1 Nuclease [Chitinophagaceae bacterium]